MALQSVESLVHKGLVGRIGVRGVRLGPVRYGAPQAYERNRLGWPYGGLVAISLFLKWLGGRLPAHGFKFYIRI